MNISIITEILIININFEVYITGTKYDRQTNVKEVQNKIFYDLNWMYGIKENLLTVCLKSNINTNNIS